MSTDTDDHENFTAKHTKSAKDFLRLFSALFAPLAVLIFPSVFMKGYTHNHENFTAKHAKRAKACFVFLGALRGLGGELIFRTGSPFAPCNALTHCWMEASAGMV